MTERPYCKESNVRQLQNTIIFRKLQGIVLLIGHLIIYNGIVINFKTNKEHFKMHDNFETELIQFGVAIKKLRECRNLTQEEVLQRTGIARSSLVEIETGKRFPRGINILRLCVLFEITPDQLMKLAFKKWKHPVKSLTSSRIGAPQQKYGDTGVASEDQPPKRIRSMRMRVDRGGDSVYNCDTSFNKTNS